MYDIRNCKFEVTVQAWRCLVVLSFMADKRKYVVFKTACTRAGKEWHSERSRASKLSYTMEMALNTMSAFVTLYISSAELKAEPQMHGYYRGLLYSTALVPFQFYR